MHFPIVEELTFLNCFLEQKEFQLADIPVQAGS